MSRHRSQLLCPHSWTLQDLSGSRWEVNLAIEYFGSKTDYLRSRKTSLKGGALITQVASTVKILSAPWNNLGRSSCPAHLLRVKGTAGIYTTEESLVPPCFASTSCTTSQCPGGTVEMSTFKATRSVQEWKARTIYLVAWFNCRYPYQSFI